MSDKEYKEIPRGSLIRSKIYPKNKYNNNFNIISKQLFAGGLAGCLNWTATYPIDVIHARQIAQHISIK